VLLLCLTLVLPYALFLLWLLSLNSQAVAEGSLPHPDAGFATLIIPVRNELENLRRLLPRLAREGRSCDTILKLILVDDHSTDDTAAFVSGFMQPGLDIQFLLLEDETGKKAALRHGILACNTDYILTIDGDCLPEVGWLRSVLNALDSQRPDLLILPIVLTGKGLFPSLQILEFAAIMSVTEGFARAGLPIMCNGANLAMSRDLWLDFDSRRHDRSIPSGDDMFLLHFAQAEGYSIAQHFTKASFVSTPAVLTLSGFTSQRLRWAGKWNHYLDWPTRLVAVFTWLFHLAYAGLFYTTLATLHFDVLALIVIFKWMPEALIIVQSLRKAGKPFNEVGFLLLQFVYSPYVVLTGLTAILGKRYSWKGRAVQKGSVSKEDKSYIRHPA